MEAQEADTRNRRKTDRRAAAHLRRRPAAFLASCWPSAWLLFAFESSGPFDNSLLPRGNGGTKRPTSSADHAIFGDIGAVRFDVAGFVLQVDCRVSGHGPFGCVVVSLGESKSAPGRAAACYDRNGGRCRCRCGDGRTSPKGPDSRKRPGRHRTARQGFQREVAVVTV